MWYIYDKKTRKKVDGYFNSRHDALNMIKNLAFLYNCGTSRWSIEEARQLAAF